MLKDTGNFCISWQLFRQCFVFKSEHLQRMWRRTSRWRKSSMQRSRRSSRKVEPRTQFRCWCRWQLSVKQSSDVEYN